MIADLQVIIRITDLVIPKMLVNSAKSNISREIFMKCNYHEICSNEARFSFLPNADDERNLTLLILIAETRHK